MEEVQATEQWLGNIGPANFAEQIRADALTSAGVR